jgi:hypothetical protein
MCLSAFLGFLAMAEMDMMTQGRSASSDGSLPLLAAAAVVQMAAAALGLVAGIQFLRLKAWARLALEALTWFLLIFVFGFMAFWILNRVSNTSGHAFAGFTLMGAFMGVVIMGIYGVPLGIMLRHLRGESIRKVMADVASPVA